MSGWLSLRMYQIHLPSSIFFSMKLLSPPPHRFSEIIQSGEERKLLDLTIKLTKKFVFWEKSRKLFRKMVPQSTINAVQLHRAQSFLKTSGRADNTSFIWFSWILFNLAFQNNNSTYRRSCQ